MWKADGRMQTPTWRDLTARQLATARARRVLLVEDDDLYVRRVRRTLLDAAPQAFSLEVAPTLAEAIHAVASKVFDVVLLDLGLPDEVGVRTFERMHKAAPRTPTIILTSADDPEAAAYTLYIGASDYLVKNASDDLLLHVIGRSISRLRPNAGVIGLDLAASDSGEPLRISHPQMFEGIVEVYAGIVNLAVRTHVQPVPDEGHRLELRTLAQQLGRANAAARDALEIHTSAIEAHLATPTAETDAWIGEARMIIIELLAMLVEFYRGELDARS